MQYDNGSQFGGLRLSIGISPVGYVIHSIRNWHFAEFEGIDTLEAADIERIHARIRPATMMRIDAAHPTEIMFRNSRVELIQREMLPPLNDA